MTTVYVSEVGEDGYRHPNCRARWVNADDKLLFLLSIQWFLLCVALLQKEKSRFPLLLFVSVCLLQIQFCLLRASYLLAFGRTVKLGHGVVIQKHAL